MKATTTKRKHSVILVIKCVTMAYAQSCECQENVENE